MFGLLGPFGLTNSYDPRITYQYCETEGEGSEFICVNKIDLGYQASGQHLVPENVWVVIPGIDTNQECTDGDGKWVLDTSPANPE